MNEVLSAAATATERAASRWLLALLGLPDTATVGFVTGAQAANTVGLAAARHQVLKDAGWDVDRDGLPGGPRVRVVTGAERHATIDRSVRLLGLGSAALEPVATDTNGPSNRPAAGGGTRGSPCRTRPPRPRTSTAR